MKAGMFPEISHEDYHADKIGEVPTLSRSIAHTIVSRSPAHARYEHPRLGGGERPTPTPDMDGGTLMGALLLGKGADIVAVDAKDWRTDLAKATRDEIRAMGKLPILKYKLDAAQETAEMLRGRLKARGIEFNGQSEVTVVWQSDGAWCRARLDHWWPNEATILDLKWTENADPVALGRHMVNYGEDIQCVSYTEAVETVISELAGRVRFRFVAIESAPPYAISICEARGTMRELGAQRWRRAVATWKDCLETGVWPEYGSGVLGVEAPPYALAQQMDKQMTAMPEGGSSGLTF